MLAMSMDRTPAPRSGPFLSAPAREAVHDSISPAKRTNVTTSLAARTRITEAAASTQSLKRNQPMLSTITRIGPLLDLFTSETPEWGVSEVAAALGIPRSNAHALLSSLADTGILQSHRGRYQIGWRVVELSELQRSSSTLRRAARPVLQKLFRQVGETVNLAVLERDMVLYVDKLVADQVITVGGPRVGSRIHAHHTALGKLLLAGRTERERERILSAGVLRRPSDGTATDVRRLRAEIAEAVPAGYALDLGETAEGLSCVGAAIHRNDGSVVAALSISAPDRRFRDRRRDYVACVRAAASEISAALTAREPRWGALDSA